MDEQEITAKLRENVPTPTEPQPVKPPESAPFGNAQGITDNFQLDDLVQYKLHEFFGEQYHTSDEESKQRVSYIFEAVANIIGTTEYGLVVAKMRDLEQIIGIAHSDNRLYKLYQWLRLDNARRKISVEMDAVR